MNVLSIVMLAFSVLGLIDKIFGNRFGIGKEFEKGFMLLGSIALSMIGMLVLSPAIASLLMPLLVKTDLPIDPSLLPVMLLANDMGGASLAQEIGSDAQIKMFNALVVSSMMGCTVSFTIPLAVNTLHKEKKPFFFKGTAFGIVTIPFGCFAGGLLLGIPVKPLLLDLAPLFAFALIVTLGILFIPDVLVKLLGVFGEIIRILILVGLAAGILKFVTKSEWFSAFGSIEEAGLICLAAAITLSGAFPFMYIISKLLRKPLIRLGKRMSLDENEVFGFLSSSVTNITTIEKMNEMESRGVILNAAFAVSASFAFGGHLAFTTAIDGDYVAAMLIGKLTAGFLAAAVAILWLSREKTPPQNA